MNRLVFTDPNNANLRVEYKVDRLEGHLQVLDITGADDAAVIKGIDFKRLDFHTQNFIEVAVAYDLTLTALPIDGEAEVLHQGVTTTTTTTTSTTTTTTSTTTL